MSHVTHILPPLLVALLMALPCAYAGTASDLDAQIPNDSNVDYACVLLARKVLGQEGADATHDIPALIQCLKSDRLISESNRTRGNDSAFEKGAAKRALVHIGQPAIPALIEALDNPHIYLATGAAMALGQMGARAKDAVPALVNILRKKDSYESPAARALGKIGEIDLLVRIFQGGEPGIHRYRGAEGLKAAGPAAASAVPALTEALKSSIGGGRPNTGIRQLAAEVLGQIGPAADPAVPQLAELLHSSWNLWNFQLELRDRVIFSRAAGEALLKIGTPQAQTAGRGYQWGKTPFYILFMIMHIFIGLPLLALGVGIVLGLLARFGFRTRPDMEAANRWLLLTAVVWMCYTFWEAHCELEGANFRIDRLVIWPFLAIVTPLGVGRWLFGRLRPKSKQP